VGKTEGRVTLANLEEYFDTVIKARAVSYSKIFDATSGTSALTEKHVEILRERIKSFMARGKVGPFAVVTGPVGHNRLTNICKSVAQADRPMRFFTNIGDARQWIAELRLAEDDDAPLRKQQAAGD
jgi:hypothetical protein